MQIEFGLNLDGYHPPKPATAFNRMTCGPRGFLQLLETRLGLLSLPVSSFKRVLQFRQAVADAANASPVFFRDSFQRDNLAAARVLLAWRDALVEAGWNGHAADTDPPRLRDMALLEKIVRSSVAPGEADRLGAVHRELGLGNPGGIHLSVLDEKAHLPHLWQCVCDQLQATYADNPDSSPGNKTAPAPPTDLALYQAHLEGNCAGKFTPKNDGTLLVLSAHSEVTLARAVAQMVCRREKNESLTLLAGAQAGILDQALAAENEPLVGMRLRSAARPIPQLLFLTLRLCWQPVDPGALLEFLTHPACPVGGLLRRRLSDAVANAPGIGGQRWLEAIAGARAVAEKIADKDKRQAAQKKIDENLARWIMMERFDPIAGAPGSKLSELCMHLSRWAAARSASPQAGEIESGHFKLLSSLASEMAEVLMPLPHIPRMELDRLLQELCSGGWEGEVAEAQLGHVMGTPDPQAVIDPADRIIWWDFSEPPESYPLPWRHAELLALQSHGVKFMSPQISAALKVKAWLRPLRAARKQLVLVLPRQRGGKALPPHPLFARLLSVTEGNPPRLPTRDIDRELYQQQALAPLTFAALDHQPLPAPRRWWTMPVGKQLVTSRWESYSSLEKFVNAPFIWVLKYPANLECGPLTTLKLRPDSALKGTLLHRLLDVLLAAPANQIDWRTCNRPALEAWCDEHWPVLLEQEGATLLLPGNLSENLSLLDLGKQSLWELLQHLRAAKVTAAQPNVKRAEVPYFGGHLVGYFDLLVTNQAGQCAVVDLKLGGENRRRQELKANRQLQLAVYGYLQHQHQKSWPEAAFYILAKQRLLAQTNVFFPDATLQKADVSPGGLENCWKDFEAVWRWRRGQLDAGWVEVTTAVLPEAPDPAAPDSTPPHESWQTQPEDIEYNDFYALTGWGANQ